MTFTGIYPPGKQLPAALVLPWLLFTFPHTLLAPKHCISDGDFDHSSQKQSLCPHFISRGKEKGIFAGYTWAKTPGTQWLVSQLEVYVWCSTTVSGGNPCVPLRKGEETWYGSETYFIP